MKREGARDMKREVRDQMENLEKQYLQREESLVEQLETIELEFDSFLDQLLYILFGHVNVQNKR